MRMETMPKILVQSAVTFVGNSGILKISSGPKDAGERYWR